MNSANLEAQLVGKGATIRHACAKPSQRRFRPCPDCSGPERLTAFTLWQEIVKREPSASSVMRIRADLDQKERKSFGRARLQLKAGQPSDLYAAARISRFFEWWRRDVVSDGASKRYSQ